QGDAEADRQEGAEGADDKAGGCGVPEGRLGEDGGDGGQPFAQDAGEGSEKPQEQDDEQDHLKGGEPAPLGPMDAGSGAEKRGGGGEGGRGDDDHGADEELDEGEIDG